MRQSTHLPWLVCLCVGLVACGAQTPTDDYDDYLERANRNRPDAGADASEPAGHFADVTGDWFLRAALTAGLDLGLRVRMCKAEVPADDAAFERCEPMTEPGTLMIRLWLEKQTIGVDRPLVETTSEVDAAGRFILRAIPLRLPADLVGSEIIANVIMDAHITSDGSWCGDANGDVTQPPGLEIDGSSFAATRDPDRAAMHFEIPFACGPEEAPGEADAGPDAADGGPDTPDAAPSGADAGIVRPASPDLSDVSSVATDVTGHWIVTAALPNSLRLQLWLSLVYAGGPDGGTLDGAIHRWQDQPGAPAAATFTTTVTPDGRFDVWLPAFQMRTSLGPLLADLLLSAATLSGETFCGEGAGRVHKPIDIALEGATFNAVRFVPGTMPTLAAESAIACPGP